jgi:myotubularin-related protein 6/7/8
MLIHPTALEFNERLLLDLHAFSHSCTFGTFLFNNERERNENKQGLLASAASVWTFIEQNEWLYKNPFYQPKYGSFLISDLSSRCIPRKIKIS